MKKTLLTVCLAIICVASFAQNSNFGIRGGLNTATFSLTAVGNGSLISQGAKSINSFNLGIFEDFKLGKTGFSIQPALCYTGKGGNFSYSDSDGNIFINEKLYYLEIPVDLVCYIPAGASNVYIGVGPYFAKGLSGTINGGLNDNEGDTGSISGNVKFGSSIDDNISATQYGVNLMAGFILKNGLLAHLSYDIGTTNDVPSANQSGGTNKSSVFSISLGYEFK